MDRYLERELRAHPRNSLSDLLEAALASDGIHRPDAQLRTLIESKRSLELQAASWFRGRIIETLVRNGISVTVYGDGWEKLDICSYPNFIRRAPVSPKEGIALMEDAKIVLNQLTWFKAGASERIFEAMLQGAVCLTDDSEYLREQFLDGEDLRFYSLEHLETLPQLAGELLTDSALSDRIRSNAYKKASAKHTWESRAEELLACLS